MSSQRWLLSCPSLHLSSPYCFYSIYFCLQLVYCFYSDYLLLSVASFVIHLSDLVGAVFIEKLALKLFFKLYHRSPDVTLSHRQG